MPYSNKILFRFRVFLFVAITIAYANSLFNEYALDDAIVITDNKFTKKGFDGLTDIFSYDSFTGFFGKEKDLVAGGRYRPLSIATFAAEWQFFGKNPYMSHTVNLSLYLLTCFILLQILLKLFPPKENKAYLNLAYVATLLFALHPMHTEVVSNIKGRDEIMALLFSLLALYYSIKQTSSIKKEYLNLFLSFVFFTAGMFSKENTITYIAVISSTLIILQKRSIGETAKKSVPLVLASALFLIARAIVLPDIAAKGTAELMNNPFIHASGQERLATTFYTWFKYIQLMLIPHPLTYDYYPYQVPLVKMTNLGAITGLLTYGGALIFSFFIFVKSIINRHQTNNNSRIFAFASICFLAPFSVVSNLAFPIGTFMNERFMYFSSIGFAIAVAYGIELLLNRGSSRTVKPIIKYSLIVIFGLYATKIISRNLAWKDDYTLFTTDVSTSFNSAKSTCSAGGKIIEKSQDITDETTRLRMLKKAHMYLNRSIKIHPKYVDALLLMGNCHFEMGNLDSTVFYYKELLKYSPSNPHVFQNILAVVNKSENLDFNIETLEFFYNKNPQDYGITYKLGVLYGKEKNDIERATPLLEKAIELNPNRKDALKDLGVAYGIAQKYDDAIRVLQMALTADPKDRQTMINLGLSYQKIGDTASANRYFLQVQKLDKK